MSKPHRACRKRKPSPWIGLSIVSLLALATVIIVDANPAGLLVCMNPVGAIAIVTDTYTNTPYWKNRGYAIKQTAYQYKVHGRTYYGLQNGTETKGSRIAVFYNLRHPEYSIRKAPRQFIKQVQQRASFFGFFVAALIGVWLYFRKR